ncbi:MAG: DUF502 domain-containing protein [Bacteroidia bacterium]
MTKKIFNYFLQGLLVTVPVVVTFVVLFKAILWIDSLLPFQVPVKIPGMHDIDIPGLGILAIFVLITIFGYFASTLFANPAFRIFEKVFERTPLVKIVYSSVKDLIEAFVGEKKRFTQPVLVTMTKDPEMQRIGFVTENDLTNLGIPLGKLAVYFPFSYGFNGQLFIVPSENVTRINASGTEMMKFIISGGVTDI